MNPRTVTALLALALVINLSACALLGYLAPLNLKQTLPRADVASALDQVFELPPGPDRAWTEATGTVSHGPFFRRAWLRGTRNDVDYTEQVLKVGWPFTTLRGFIRQRDSAVDTTGVALMKGTPSAGPVRFLPLQPVWPGLVINTLLLAGVLFLGRRWMLGR